MKNNKKNYCTFYIIRHGETQWNIEGKLQGQQDSPLTENGINGANELAKKLRQIRFDYVFASDLMRAKLTAEIVALEQDLAVVTTKLLRERGFGQYEGYTVKRFREELKDLIAERESLSVDQRFAHKLNDEIESDEELTARFITFLREVALAYPGKRIAAISHGGMLRALLIHLGFANYAELQHGAIGNLAYFIVESDGVDFFLKETFGINKIGS